MTFSVLCFFALSICNAAPFKNDPSLSAPDFEINLPGGKPPEKANAPQQAAPQKNSLDQTHVKKIQTALKIIGYAPGEISGLIDLETSAAMKQFRDDFEMTAKGLFSDPLITTLFHYADVAQVHPDWKAITLSDDFTQWINQQPTEQRIEISKLRRSGTAQQIIALINDYKADQKKALNDEKPKQDDVKPLPDQKTAAAKVASKKEPVREITAKTDAHKAAPKIIEKKVTPVTILTEPPSSETGTPPEETSVVNNPPKEASGAENASASETSTDTDPPPAKDADTPPNKDAEAGISFQTLLAKAKEEYAFDASKTIQWLGGPCGCLTELPPTVYGFYPFWMAGEEQVINFSLLSRVGYYALSFDENGNIPDFLHWKKGAADFINEAQKHRTKVDLVIFKNDWTEWAAYSDKKRTLIIDHATTNMVNAVNQPFGTSLSTRIKSLVASENSQTLGDGVTIYFDRYPEDEGSIDSFVQFIHQLKKKLRAAGEDYALNLMLPMQAIGTGIYTYENLGKFMGKKETMEDDDIDRFIIFLEEPTTDTKKSLRQAIEQEFKGIQRRNMLRKIIPMIRPEGHDKDKSQQLDDDLIYFEDNFGGVAFWPLPIIGNDGTKQINDGLKARFKKKSGRDFMAKKISENAPSLCKFVCPKRWGFRLGLDILVTLLVLFRVFSFFIPEVNAVYKKYRLYYRGIGLFTVAVFYSSMMCDPHWNALKDEVTVGLIVLGIFYWGWRSFYKMKQADYP